MNAFRFQTVLYINITQGEIPLVCQYRAPLR